MKISILTLGSRGDVQPYLALGRGLQKAGYEINIGVDSRFEDFVREVGLEFSPVTADPMEALQEDIRQIGNNPVKVFNWIKKNAGKISNEVFASTYAACRDSDAMIFSGLAFAGLHVAEALQIPALATSLLPIIPTNSYPYPLAPALPRWLPFRGTLNRWSYTGYNKLFFRMMLGLINDGREEILGLPALPWRFYARLDLSLYNMIYGFSRHVLPKPDDWDELQHVTGNWFLDLETGWNPPENLVAFLEQGTKPVYVGFGSMVDKEAEELTRLVVEALSLSNQRAVLLSGWSDLGGEGLPATVIKVGNVPHNWLFRRVAAVVHHGGAGTTAAGLRAGAPTIVVPFFADQPFWGQRVYELGAGPKPVPRLKLTAEKLGAAIRVAVEDDGMAKRAAELGEKLRAEDGVATAVAVIKKLFDEKPENIFAKSR